MKKRLLSLLLVLSMMLTLLPGTVWAAEVLHSGMCGNNLTWQLDSQGTLTISGTGDMENYNIKTPWYDFRSDIKAVVIQNGVVSIGSDAFFHCEALASVSLPDGLQSIGAGSFTNCTSLKRISLPAGITEIKARTFQNSGLSEVHLPDGLKTIGAQAFDGCEDLKNITIPRSVSSIGSSAFMHSGLTAVTIPGGVTTIDSQAFFDCKNLTKAVVENGVTALGASMFLDCVNLTSVTLPESLETIGGSAFSHCTSLTEIKLPGRLTSIGGNAFNNTGFTTVEIPKSITTIGAFAFGYSALENITIPGSAKNLERGILSGNKNLKSVVLEPGIPCITESMFSNCSSLEHISIPGSVIRIEEKAFSHCTSLTDLAIPDNTAYIGAYAFSDTGLNSIILPASVVEIGTHTFMNCSNLQKATILGSVSFLPMSSFYGCTALQKVRIPDSVTDIDRAAFCQCDRLSDVYYAGTAEQWQAIAVAAKNDPLTNATIHYSSGENIPEAPDQPEVPDQPDPPHPSTGVSKIIAFTPASGATFPGTVFDITFDREVTESNTQNQPLINLGCSAPFEIHKMSDDTVVYTVDSPYRVINDFGYGPSRAVLRISPTNANVFLETGVDYYVTMGAGFVQLADGKTNPEIKKGEWVFTAEKATSPGTTTLPSDSPIRVEAKFHHESAITAETETYPFLYDDAWFTTDSTSYQHDLATMSLAMAMAAYGKTEGNSWNRAANIRGLFDKIGLGYSENSIHYVTPGYDTIGYAIGGKTVEDGDDSFTLIAVAVRGGGYGDEWASNFTIGNSATHDGFTRAANEVVEGILRFIKENHIPSNSNVKIWLTGFSRAAATANIVAKQLNDYAESGRILSGISKKDIYAYCFECPQGVKESLIAGSNATNIFNIVNHIDLVTKVAPNSLLRENGTRYWTYGRYGNTYFLPSSELKSKNFSMLYKQMKKTYADLLGDHYSDAFTKYAKFQGDAYQMIIDEIASVVMDPYVYTADLQDVVRKKVAEVMGKPSGPAKTEPGFGELFLTALSASIHPVAPHVLLMVRNLEDGITTAHYAELCYAWMQTLNGSTEFSPRTNRRIYINCPVDVEVYNDAGTLVVQIENDQVADLPDSTIGAYLDKDGQKVIILPVDDRFTLKLSATDAGTVTYTAAEQNVDTNQVEKVVSYCQVDIKSGDVLTGIAEDASAPGTTASYPLSLGTEGSEGPVALMPTVSQTGDIATYRVTAAVSGNGSVIGGGAYITGEYAKVSATANDEETFLGWYVDDTRVSTDAEYRFPVNQNLTVTAKFTQNTRPSSPSTGGSSGSGSSRKDRSDRTSYAVSVPSSVPGGKVTVQPANAKKGTSVTITAQPDSGCQLNAITVTNSRGEPIAVTNRETNQYVFTMPSSAVHVNVSFAETNAGQESAADKTGFTDIPVNEYYYDAVLWAREKGITQDITTTAFGPDLPCTRALMVTFLWRASGSPAPKGTVLPFVDVQNDAYYRDAVLWALEQGITAGTSESTFSPEAPATRGQAVVFLHHMAGSPKADGQHPFDDVPPDAYYTDAVQWAVGRNIVAGTTPTLFRPDKLCLRAQILTFLYHDMV